MAELNPVARSGVCRVCKCTDADCSKCIERSGVPCSWVEPDLCSACQAALRLFHNSTDRAARRNVRCPHCGGPEVRAPSVAEPGVRFQGCERCIQVIDTITLHRQLDLVMALYLLRHTDASPSTMKVVEVHAWLTVRDLRHRVSRALSLYLLAHPAVLPASVTMLPLIEWFQAEVRQKLQETHVTRN